LGNGCKDVTPDRVPAALFTAAVLSSYRDLDDEKRLDIISRVPAFDIKSFAAAQDALDIAFHKARIAALRGVQQSRIAAAARSTDEWLNKKIFVMSRRNLMTPERHGRDIPEVVFACGDPSIASSRATAVLNSRKSRRPCADDSWITATKSLVRYAKQAKLTVISSYGTIPYCIVSRLAFGMPLIVVCDDVLPFMAPPSHSEEFLSKYDDLFRFDSTLFISPFPPGTNLPKAKRLGKRDLLVAALASVLLVAELRSGGNMEEIMESSADRRIEVVQYSANDAHASAPAKPVAHTSPPQALTTVPEFRQIADKTSYLIHYTRACPGPWPGQTTGDYCLSLINGCQLSAHTGFDTLLRILGENLIRGSSRLTRGAYPVVSLTECFPEEILALSEWRRGLIRWSFEPYGIALSRDDLFNHGARPVIYAIGEAFHDLSLDLRYLFQLQGKNSTNWSPEKEWRVRGDLVLSRTLRNKMIVIVRSGEEAAIIAEEFGSVVALATTRRG
jgi:predicted Rossmann fold nucleotide-binding protein DprA/Smf involved in DNA uptake